MPRASARAADRDRGRAAKRAGIADGARHGAGEQIEVRLSQLEGSL